MKQLLITLLSFTLILSVNAQTKKAKKPLTVKLNPGPADTTESKGTDSTTEIKTSVPEAVPPLVYRIEFDERTLAALYDALDHADYTHLIVKDLLAYIQKSVLAQRSAYEEKYKKVPKPEEPKKAN